LTALLDEGKGNRTIAARVNVVKPSVTTATVAQQYPTYLTLDRSTYQLKLWKNLELEKTYTVAVGQVGLETPAGLYSIQDKQVDPAWHVPNSDWAGDLAGQVIPGGTAENPLKARWMGIFNGAGIHGTSDEASLGSAASHGCVRMAVTDVIDLYDRVDVGTPIYIG
jgi:lipoprotein-anchoring transpeptidase ErfK/SrfK